MRKLYVLLFAMLFLMAIPATAFAAWNATNPAAPSTTPNVSFTPVLTDGDTLDNSAGNANRSGGDIGNVDIQGVSTATYDQFGIIKSKNMRDTFMSGGTGTNQRTHGVYQNNTNSCASCHQTHTGASKDLLIKAGVYNTCTACHDGTLGFYDVFNASTAGTFGGTSAGNASVHLANGTAFIGMAPGFNNYTSDPDLNQVPEDQFDCAACHAPHGSYSDRLLHYSPAGMANVSTAQKGNKLVGLQKVTAVPDFATGPDAALLVVDGADPIVSFAAVATGTNVGVVIKKGASAYEVDTTPWVAGYEHAMDDQYNSLRILYYTQFKNGNTPINNELTIIYGKAFASGTFANVTQADVAQAYVVKLHSDDPAYEFNPIVIGDFGGIPIWKINTDIYDEEGYGRAISKYCGACHTDYMTASRDPEGQGVYRHTTNNDRFNCLKCHFAHGTDATVMKDARDRTIATLVAAAVPQATALEYMKDKNPSSALKRYTNMAVCWKCHSGVEGKSSKLMNNDYYWEQIDTNPQGGFNSVAPLEDNWTKNTWE